MFMYFIIYSVFSVHHYVLILTINDLHHTQPQVLSSCLPKCPQRMVSSQTLLLLSLSFCIISFTMDLFSNYLFSLVQIISRIPLLCNVLDMSIPVQSVSFHFSCFVLYHLILFSYYNFHNKLSKPSLIANLQHLEEQIHQVLAIGMLTLRNNYDQMSGICFFHHM